MGSMKYDKYEKMTQAARETIAADIIKSFRGSFIISKALHYAIEELKKQERPEWSDICDMMLLREQIFPLYVKSDEDKFNGSKD